jgi:hypothetical protein
VVELWHRHRDLRTVPPTAPVEAGTELEPANA